MYTNRCSLAGCKKKEVCDLMDVAFEKYCCDVYLCSPFSAGPCEVQYLSKELLY